MIASAIGAGAALVGSTIGAISSALKNKKANNLIQQQRDENKRWYEMENSADYTQRSDVQAVLKKQRELLDERYKNTRGVAAVSGGTDEAVAMQKKAANESLDNTMTNIAANADSYKSGVQQQYRQADAQLNQQQAQIKQQQAAQVAQAAGQAVGAGLNLVGATIGQQVGKPASSVGTNPVNVTGSGQQQLEAAKAATNITGNVTTANIIKPNIKAADINFPEFNGVKKTEV